MANPNESNLLKHARHELEKAGWFDTSKGSLYDGMIGPAVMRLMETFASEGHSGMSASIARALFHTVVNYEPLTPLTGADDEWNDCGDTLQNRRCSWVFKDKATGRAYNTNGRVFEEPNGSRYTSRASRVDVTFPYTPTTEYVPASEDPGCDAS